MKSSIHNDSFLDKKNNVHYNQLTSNKDADNKMLDTESNKEISEREQKKKKYTEYKGVHYKKEKSVRYYEHGAHFKYQELYDILNSLLKVEAETNCETANFTNNNSTKVIFSHQTNEFKSNANIKLNDNEDLKNTNYNESNKDKSYNQSSLLLQNNFKSINKNNLTIQDEENIKFRKSGLVNNNPYSNITSKVKQAFNIGSDIKEKEKKSAILPPINQKIQNLEYVTSKIDTGLKSLITTKKESDKTNKLLERNQIVIEDPNSDKAKKFQAFNKQLASVYKNNATSNLGSKQQTNISEKEKEKLKSLSLLKNATNKSVNPNSLNFVLNNMNKLSNNNINLKSLHMPNIK